MLVLFLMTTVLAYRTGTQKPNTLLPLPLRNNDVTLATKLTLDANWRWLNGDILEGSGTLDELRTIYGITPADNGVTLQYVTQNPYGTNVGSRLYLLESSGSRYHGFNLRDTEFSFDVEFDLPCGTNAAVYFVELPLHGDLNAAYGTGYGDAQCPRDLKLLEGKGSCAFELDVMEANMYAMAFASHPCKGPPKNCSDAVTCGEGSNRYSGYCDKDGADFNRFRLGDRTFFGRGSNFKIDSTKKFRVITQFTNQQWMRYYEQNGIRVAGGVLTDTGIAANKAKFKETNYHEQLGGLASMLSRTYVLVVSLWDDTFANMAWLDSVYPPGGTAPGNLRGPCSQGASSLPENVRKTSPNSKVTFSNFALRSLGTNPPPTIAPTAPITPKDIWECRECVIKQK